MIVVELPFLFKSASTIKNDNFGCTLKLMCFKPLFTQYFPESCEKSTQDEWPLFIGYN